MVKEGMTDMCVEYADIVFDISVIYLQISDNSKSEQSLDEAFRVYRTILPEDVLRDKCEIALNYFKSAGGVKLPDYLSLDFHAKT